MKIWLVGGAVRDALMGLPVQDRDWVAVGGRPEDLLAQGYLPVGQDFPVFLHPHTHEEVALARTERKTGPGYHGFSFHAAPQVTLEEDLLRRDLTINAMAQDESGQVIDPYGGRRDLADKVLRHVSAAFCEDPVRILRLARFAARMPDFRVAPETMKLMQDMVHVGEVDALVSERVWQEISRGLLSVRPSRMFGVLRDCGALAKLLPEVDRLWGVPQSAAHHPEIDTGDHLMRVLDVAAADQAPLTVRFACLGHDLGKGTTPFSEWPQHTGHEQRSTLLVRAMSERLRVPTECRELAEVVAREHAHVHASAALDAEGVVQLLTRCDALRRPDRFSEILWACECDSRGRLGFEQAPYPARQTLWRALEAAMAIDTSVIASAAAKSGLRGPQIGQKIHAARVEAVQSLTKLT
jgi:tRNA nucleotidyltransferase (CCA-adding enzyme)